MLAPTGCYLCYDSAPHFPFSLTCPPTYPVICMPHITHPKGIPSLPLTTTIPYGQWSVVSSNTPDMATAQSNPYTPMLGTIRDLPANPASVEKLLDIIYLQLKLLTSATLTLTETTYNPLPPYPITSVPQADQVSPMPWGPPAQPEGVNDSGMP